MTFNEAEAVKQKLEGVLNKETREGLKNIEVFVAPSLDPDFQAFRKIWRNSTYVVALATFGHCDMNVYVCDNNYLTNEEEFETIDQFTSRRDIAI